ncbi:helix-turn-helix transcriptional regulator [Selenomonas caprae]|uniref:Helix-turn-helix transcriptional regulator n=1 Tax=Selenomonas caprae TaxID=2606905 RepID=A0A5D6WDY7_9FIRM|nr:helix-turn-helix transcriptional regulator [Selenomonas caprae]
MRLGKLGEQMNQIMKAAYPHTRLREYRDNYGLSQSELASESGVLLRQIQLFEQGQRNINKTAAVTLYKLAKALHCRMEDLLEPLRKNVAM